jgi:two-component system chemotaxis response regulator CheB
MKYEAMVVGVSAGGVEALNLLLPCLPSKLPIPVMVVLHIGKFSVESLIAQLNNKCKIVVKEADSGEKILTGHVYFAPPNYHLLVECNRTFSLAVGEFVKYSRPSIDVLFESAADIYREKLIGVILTGANSDGAQGMKAVNKFEGYTIAQDPKDAFIGEMPGAAIAQSKMNKIYTLNKLTMFFKVLDKFVIAGNESLLP